LRIDKELPVELKISSDSKKLSLPLKISKAIVKNIGNGGAFIEILEFSKELIWLLNKGRLFLEIELSPSATIVQARVKLAWKKENKSTLSLGLEFEDISFEDRQLLYAFIEDSFKTKSLYVKWRRNPLLKLENLLYERAIKKVMPSFAKLTRILVGEGIRLWIRKIHGLNNIPEKGGCIFVANHASYCDFLMVSAFMRTMRKRIYFLATKKLSYHPIMKYFMYYNEIIYIDRDEPGVGYFKRVVDVLKRGNVVVFFPEGTRSITGKIQKPKSGFIKLAIVAKVPIIPVAFKGTFQILPKHSGVPKLKKADIFIGRPIQLEKYYKKHLGREEIQGIADNIMDEIGSMVNYSRAI